MRKILFTITIIVAVATISAQQYKITFAARNNATIDKVEVINTTKNISLTLNGSDILLLGSGLEKENFNEDFKIFPNPIENEAEITIFAKTKGTMQIFLYNTEGKQVAMYSNYLDQGGHKIILKDLPQGNYIISVMGNEYSYSSKIVSNGNTKGVAEIIYKESFIIPTQAEIKSKNYMPYDKGDKLTFKATSGNLTKKAIDSPQKDKKIAFDFTATTSKACAPFTFHHSISDGVSPMDIAIDYNVVQTDIANTGMKCWITQNLGALYTASAPNDIDPDAAGWYWQYSRKEGYYIDATGVAYSPIGNWISPYIFTTLDWQAADDPCSILFGTDWRIPTQAEWKYVSNQSQWNYAPDWIDYYDTYNSPLQLHAAGRTEEYGKILFVGDYGHYCSSTNNTQLKSYYFHFGSNFTYAFDADSHSYGKSIRCLRD